MTSFLHPYHLSFSGIHCQSVFLQPSAALKCYGWLAVPAVSSGYKNKLSFVHHCHFSPYCIKTVTRGVTKNQERKEKIQMMVAAKADNRWQLRENTGVILHYQDIKKPQDMKVHTNIKTKTKHENITTDRERGKVWLIKKAQRMAQKKL